MKKISRKDLAGMSSREVLAAAREPYRRLATYLRPYKSRFALGIVFGLLAGMTNGGLVWVTRSVGNQVLGGKGEPTPPTAGFQTPSWVPQWVPVIGKPPGHADAEPVGQGTAATTATTTVATTAAGAAAPAPATTASTISQPAVSTLLEESGSWLHRKPAQPGAASGTGLAEVSEPASDLPERTPLSRIIWVCALIPALMLVRGLFGYLNAYCMQWVSLKTLDDIRQDVFERVLAQSQEFFNSAKVGDLIQTIFNQTRMAQMALTQVASDVVKQPVSILAALAAMLWVDPLFTLFSFTIFPLCVLPVLYMGRKVRKSSNQEEQEAGSLMNIMNEALGGIRVVKAHSREVYEAKRFSAANQKMLAMIMRWRKAMELTGPLVEATASLGISAALVYAFWRGMNPGDFLALTGALVLIYEPAKSLGRLHILLQKCLAATSKIFELMDRVPGVKDDPAAIKLKKARGHVELRGVSFAYDTKKQPAVRDVDLVIPAGSTCALVGQTGSGKSTLVSLLLRFYDPTEGAVLVDGQDIRHVTQRSLRDQIALVNQEIFLFHDTIFENIRYGRLDATREEVEAAARRAHAHEFIMQKPEGYESDIGDRGGKLSGGQKQRLCIARAFLRNAPILILDEATSSLDSETEANIQADLDELAKNRTVIAIAHRLSTILRADQIVVMEHGQVTDIGTHAALLGRSERYQRLYHMQFESVAAAVEPVETT